MEHLWNHHVARAFEQEVNDQQLLQEGLFKWNPDFCQVVQNTGDTCLTGHWNIDVAWWLHDVAWCLKSTDPEQKNLGAFRLRPSKKIFKTSWAATKTRPWATWMSQEVRKWLVNGLFHLLISGALIGVKTNPLILTFYDNFQWDIQAAPFLLGKPAFSSSDSDCISVSWWFPVESMSNYPGFLLGGSGSQAGSTDTWLICPWWSFKSPLWIARNVGPLPNRVTNHLLNGVILQVLHPWKLTAETWKPLLWKGKSSEPNLYDFGFHFSFPNVIPIIHFPTKHAPSF